MTRSLASLELWCSLARDVVTVTHTPGAPYEVPDGWNGFLFPRNDRVNWLVLIRATRDPSTPTTSNSSTRCCPAPTGSCRCATSAKGDIGRRVIAMRHDVDDNRGSFDTALRWPAGSSSAATRAPTTCCTAPTTGTPTTSSAALEFEELGHEVGIHVNAIAEGLRQQRSPDWILRRRARRPPLGRAAGRRWGRARRPVVPHHGGIGS